MAMAVGTPAMAAEVRLTPFMPGKIRTAKEIRNRIADILGLCAAAAAHRPFSPQKLSVFFLNESVYSA
jgi:hypothetical protein